MKDSPLSQKGPPRVLYLSGVGGLGRCEASSSWVPGPSTLQKREEPRRNGQQRVGDTNCVSGILYILSFVPRPTLLRPRFGNLPPLRGWEVREFVRRFMAGTRPGGASHWGNGLWDRCSVLTGSDLETSVRWFSKHREHWLLGGGGP